MSSPRNSFAICLFNTLVEIFLDTFVSNSFFSCFHINVELLLEELPSISSQILGWLTIGHIHISLECDERSEEPLVFSYHHNVADNIGEGFNSILYVHRGNILTPSSNDKFLYSARNVQETLRVDSPSIS
jgi:hypothetical protein